MPSIRLSIAFEVLSSCVSMRLAIPFRIASLAAINRFRSGINIFFLYKLATRNLFDAPVTKSPLPLSCY